MIAETADALREGIARGYLAAGEAIAWARDEASDGRADLAPLLGELALAEHQSESRILLMLGQLAWGADPERVGRIAAAQLRERLADGRLDPQAVARAIYHLFRDGFAPDTEFEGGARRFTEEFAAPERGGARVEEIAAEMLRFLARYASALAPDETPAATTAERDHATILVERVAAGRVEASVRLAWQWWSGRIRLTAPLDALEAFATELRDFAAHDTRAVRFQAGGEAGGGRLELLVREYGRARRAALGITLLEPRLAGRSRRGNELTVVLPTEHELLGEFAADLAETLATGGGVARLRLLRRWPGDS